MIRTTKLAYIFMFLGSGINFAIPLSGTNTHSGWGFIGFITGLILASSGCALLVWTAFRGERK